MRRLVNDLERAFAGITAGNYPGEWDEDHIPFSLMRAMRSLFDFRWIRYNGFEKIVHWLSYKIKEEQKHYSEIYRYLWIFNFQAPHLGIAYQHRFAQTSPVKTCWQFILAKVNLIFASPVLRFCQFKFRFGFGTQQSCFWNYRCRKEHVFWLNFWKNFR